MNFLELLIAKTPFAVPIIKSSDLSSKAKAVILFLLQIYLLYGNMDTEQFKQTHKLSSVTSSLIYLLGVISCMSALILYTILKYFTTDG